MNHVVLMGRLTRDPELKYSQAGKAFSKFTVAVNREFNREEADFINCTAWGKMVETIAEYLRKGRKIALQSRISVSSYEQNGETKWSTEVIVDKFEFVDTANSKEGEKPLIQKKNRKAHLQLAMTMMKSWMTMIFHSKYLGRRKEAYEKNKNLQKNAGKILLTINKFFIIISHNYKKSITIIGIKNK